MSSLKPIKSCVLGVGLGGLTFHIPFVLALPELFTLHAVLERKPTGPGGKIAARFGPEVAQGVKIYRDYEEVLGDSELGLVIISTPSGTHYDLARRALEAGKHGMPLATYVLFGISYFPVQPSSTSLLLRQLPKRTSSARSQSPRISYSIRSRIAVGTQTFLHSVSSSLSPRQIRSP